jgi:plasmid maintenance system killer protein
MIKSFRDRACHRLWMGEFVKRFSGIEKQALRKLDMLHTARGLNDLRATSKPARSADGQPSWPALHPDQWPVAHLFHLD